MTNLMPYFTSSISFLIIVPVIFAVYFLIKKIVSFKAMLFGFGAYMTNFIVLFVLQIIMSFAARDFFENHITVTMSVQAVFAAVSITGIFYLFIAKFMQEADKFAHGAGLGMGLGLWQVISEQGKGMVYAMTYYVMGKSEDYGEYLESLGAEKAEQVKTLIENISAASGTDYILMAVAGAAYIVIMAAVGVAVLYAVTKKRKPFLGYAALGALGACVPYYLSTAGIVNFPLEIFSLLLAGVALWFMVKAKIRIDGEEKLEKYSYPSPLLGRKRK